MTTPLLAQLADARQRLIQTGTRNRLVHTARHARQSKSIDIIDERSDDAFRILVRDGRRMRFGHDPSVREKPTDEEDAGPQVLPAAATAYGEDHYIDLTLQTRFGQDRLQKKLLALAREARTLEEEQGINALYIAMGFLRWYEEDRSEIVREAPLVLVPVALRRNDRTSAYEVEVREDDIVTNEPLKHRLNDEFGIKLPEVPESEDWLPGAYFDAVADAISGQPRWSIDRDGMQVGFFSFAKLLMVKDLEPERWPDNRIVEHPLVAGLLLDGFAPEAEAFPESPRLDELFAPADLVQVVDADSSQTLVIETVRRGRNLVVQGPPGTGKSQTITNIIASAAHDGKSVLFVAEKMAALNVVHERLKAAGLQDVCLELHSRSANKRLVAEELGRTLGAAATTPGTADAEELTRLRDRLNEIADVMHQPVGASDVTAYRALSTLVRLNEAGFEAPDLAIAKVETWSRQQLDQCLAAAATLSELTLQAGPKQRHPFFGVERGNLLPMDLPKLRPRLEALLVALQSAERSAAAAAALIEIAGTQSAASANGIAAVLRHIADLTPEAAPFAAAVARGGRTDVARQLAEAGRQFQEAQARYGVVFSRAALTARIDHLRAPLVAGRSFFSRLGSKYRNASAELASLMKTPLPEPQPARLALLNDLAELQDATGRLEAHRNAAGELLGALWQGEATDFTALAAATDWLDGLGKLAAGLDAAVAIGLRGRMPAEELNSLAGDLAERVVEAQALTLEMVNVLGVDVGALFGTGLAEEVAFAALGERARLWLENLHRLDEWTRLSTADETLRGIAGTGITDAVARGTLAPDQLQSTIRHIHADGIYRTFAAGHAWATRLTAGEKAQIVGDFRQRESERRGAVARMIRGQHLAGLPRGGMGAMGIVRAEIGKKRGHKPIRRLMTDAGAVVQEIKPILLMSPISVAQYLPPGVMNFDLLVIDEASQVRPEDAIGAIARARQIVVVGDKKQLPPTSFFDRIISDTVEEEPEEESEIQPARVTSATALESILTLCEARGLPSRMLRWHYRSRHPSLIAVSNELFYSDNGGGLILFPSPAATTDDDGLTLRRVPGAYDRGGKRNNVIEADAVAGAVAAHAARFPSRSLGVVTFSTAQRDTINERLALLRQKDQALDVFMREGRKEEFFVKNIENVQGDERDVIFISVGYGPRVAGDRLDNMAFGPVSTEGGERRLNVLFTRARNRTEVFVSFDPADIDLARGKNAGARVLKQFLQFAETGIRQKAAILDEDPDSDFEIAVAAEIRRLGYEVDHQVGSAGFRIDLAVRRPGDDGRYMLAVECDGASYHSAVWARERDRQRQEVLEGLNWKFHRVWSTDWFHRRADEVRRLESALLAAINDKAPVAIEDEAPVDSEEPEDDALIVADTAPGDLPDYALADFAVTEAGEPHEIPVSVMAPIVGRIIEIEGPVHEEEIGRRVATLFGKQRAGTRIAGAVRNALLFLQRRDTDVLEDDGFWLRASQQAAVPLRNRARAPVTLRKPAMLPPMEIAGAVSEVIRQNGALSWDELPRAVALLFGFQRTGPEFRPAVIPVIEALLHSGELVEGPAGLQFADKAAGATGEPSGA